MNEPTVKQKLRKEFESNHVTRPDGIHPLWSSSVDAVFEWFWKHLEASEKANFELAAHQCPHAIAGEYGDMVCKALHDKEELIKAADDVIRLNQIQGEGVNYVKALEHYQTLKSKQNGKETV